MLSPADAALVARDPAVPGLALLLDDDALSALLGGRVARRYLRYKPGTSAVCAATLDGRDVAVQVVADDGIGKLDKTAARAPSGSVLLDRRGLLVTTPAADRDLPGVGRLPEALHRMGLLPAPVTRLSWKPARRYVGRLGEGVVLRLHRELPVLPDGLPGTRTPLGVDAQLAVRALPFTAGRPLDEVLRGGGAADRALHRTGETLAALHLTRAPGLVAHDAGLDAAAAQVGVLLPDLAGDAAELAARLRPSGGDAVLHGDFSADQVVAEGDDVVLLDLDRVRLGAPADDLACWRAAALLGGLPRAAEACLLEGYAGVAPLPDPEEVAVHTSAHLLRRAAEPFRAARPDWEQQVRAVLQAARDQATVRA